MNDANYLARIAGLELAEDNQRAEKEAALADLAALRERYEGLREAIEKWKAKLPVGDLLPADHELLEALAALPQDAPKEGE